MNRKTTRITLGYLALAIGMIVWFTSKSQAYNPGSNCLDSITDCGLGDSTTSSVSEVPACTTKYKQGIGGIWIADGCGRPNYTQVACVGSAVLPISVCRTDPQLPGWTDCEIESTMGFPCGEKTSSTCYTDPNTLVCTRVSTSSPSGNCYVVQCTGEHERE